MNIKYFVFLLILFSCGAKENKLVVDKYPSGKPRVIYTIYEGNQSNLIKADYLCLYENGDTLKKGKFIDNKEEGEWKYYYLNNKISSKGFFSKGKKVGKGFRFYESGQVEQECVYENNQVTSMTFFYRNGKIKPQNIDYSYLIKDNSITWNIEQLKKVKDRCFVSLMYDYYEPMQFCDCIIDTLSKHIDFATMDTLTDYERGFLLGALMKKGNCVNLLVKK